MTDIKSGIITAPVLTVVATSRIDPTGMQQFFSQEGLTDLLEKATTPAARIMQNVLANEEGHYTGDRPTNPDGSTAYTDAELLPEFAGRFCYKSWAKGRQTDEYIENILDDEHGSILEHTVISVAITGVSRSLTHELIRHRAGVAISQESQRYVDAKSMCFVMPPLLLHYVGHDSQEAKEWHTARMAEVEDYEKWQALMADCIDHDDDISDVKAKTAKKKRANEAARASLPNASETKLTWTANLRTMRHVIETRGADPADLEIRRFAVELCKICKSIAPTVFADFEVVDGDFGVPLVTATYRKV